MKSFSRRAAAVVLAAALSLPGVAFAAPQKKEPSNRKGQVIRLIKKVFGISTNDDIPTPPIPKSDPPANS
jgi:hypothetical protein